MNEKPVVSLPSGLKPTRGLGNSGLQVVQTKEGLMFDNATVLQTVKTSINQGNYFQRRAKTMTQDLNEASETIEQALDFFNQKLNQFVKTEAEFVQKTKKQSGDLRDAVQKLGDGLARIEKTANFDRLERMVLLIERAADAMERLQALQASGKLDKILAAMK